MTDTPVNRAARHATVDQVAGAAGWLRIVDGEDVTGLAVESSADTGQRAEANRLGAPVLQDAEIDQGDAHVLGELGQGHSPVGQDRVEMDADAVGVLLLRGIGLRSWHRDLRASRQSTASP